MAKSRQVHHSINFQKTLEWNRKRPQAADKHVHCLIDAQAAQHAESQAVCSWDGNLTYSELVTLSSCWAKNLASSHSVGPEVIVPLFFEKSMWAVVALLAVLKAGGAFLLLDVSQPVARLKSIVRETGATFALSSATCFEIAKALVCNTLVVDTTTIFHPQKDNPYLPCQCASLTNMAYVVFTSGSTGTPKGIIIEHLQLASTAIATGGRLGYESNSRVFQFASYAFDACITDIFATLAHGGTVCIPSEWERNNAVIDAMRRMQVTSAKFTPSLARNLVIEDVPTLTTLVLGGESCPASLVERWASKFQVILVYGPAECCVICFISDVSQRKPAPGEIGRPVSARAWVVKQENYNELVQIGETGELLIEGPLLGRGYLNNHAMTDRQFIQSPAWMTQVPTGSPQLSRLYRTGDLAKYLDNGTVCYVGRVDNQVKIRGQRLELEEVERALQGCLNVRGNAESTTVVVEAVALSGTMNRQLIAFLRTDDAVGCLDWGGNGKQPILRTSTPEQECFSALVRKIDAMMRRVLPSYAVPSCWVPLRHLPLTTSKKVDRHRLRSIVASLSAKQIAVFASPSAVLSSGKTPGAVSEHETMLQRLWADALEISLSMIGPEDNFFALGGDSLVAIKLVTAGRAIGLDLEVEIIFKHPVLRDMAQFTKTRTVHEKDKGQSVIPRFSLLPKAWDVYQVCHTAEKQCLVAGHSIQDVYPCSPTQEGLLMLSMRDPQAYILRFVYRIQGSVDVGQLKAAWTIVALRTPVLRTRFFEYESHLLQAVVEDSLSWDVKSGSLATFLAVEEEKRSMLCGEKMSLWTVIQQKETQENYLVWTVHHALVDRWSESLIIAAICEEYLGHSSKSLKNPPFNSFINYIGRQDKQAAERFWRQQLSHAPAPVFPRLPRPGYTPRVQSSNQVPHHINTSALKSTSFTRGCATTATMIQAAWLLLVSIYSNSSEIITGVTLNGRTSNVDRVDCIAGPTLTTVPFRARIASDKTVCEFLQMIQNQYLNILPFSQFGLKNISQLTEDILAASKFRNLLVVQTDTQPQSAQGMLRREGYSFPAMEFAIVMECETSKQSIDLRATFDPQVLSRAQVRRICCQMGEILHRIFQAGPQTTVSELQGISQSDVLHVVQWNTMDRLARASTLCVHKLIERQAHCRGTDPAICAWDGELSYKILDIYSSRLAAHLQLRYGVRAESLVPICFDKSLWAVVSMVAVLKAGGACVPINPRDPLGRLRTILSKLGESCSLCVLASPSEADRLNELGVRVLAVDKKKVEQLGQVTSACDTVTADNAAFVVFTSGSTGAPKGIVIEHKAFCSGALAWGPFIQRSERSRVFQFASYTFDVSIGDVFTTLIFGGCVCIPSEHDRMNNLREAIESLKANQLSLTPTVARLLRPQELPDVKVLVVAGEPLTKEVIDIWADHVNLINMYGPAECTVYCTGKAGFRRADNPRCIGRGIGAGTWIVKPEDWKSLTPIGGIGEILIEGPLLARGYLGDDSQTHSAFVTDPPWAAPGGRFYRTGDLASYDSDGSLLFMGRNDGQIKLRGQRLEPAEVEYQLRKSLPVSVGVAVSTVRPKGGDTMLAAFLSLDGKQGGFISSAMLENSPKTLQRFQMLVEDVGSKLRCILPHYMVPSLYIPIRALPLLTSAKVNHKALQHLASMYPLVYLLRLKGHENNARNSQIPTTRMERRISSLWKVLLDTEQIRVNDSFFALGGNSVLAMRLVSMARKRGITMTVSEIFQHPTLSALALTARENTAMADLPPFALLHISAISDLSQQALQQCGICSVEEIEDIYPCSTMQLHYVTGYPEAGKKPSDPWDWQSQMVFYLSSSMDLQRFQDVWNTAIFRHPTLRTRLINTPSGIFQVVVREPGHTIWQHASDLEQYCRSDRSSNMTFGDRLLRLAIVDSHPLNSQRYFVMTAHHSIYDGFSRSMLFEELQAAHSDKVFLDDPLPKMTQFIKYITEIDKAPATEFWTSYLAGAVTKPLLILPLATYAPFNLIERKATLEIPGFCATESTLPTMIEVASGLAIAQRLGCPDVIFYVDRSGRNLPVEGIQDLIGPTTLFLPVRIHVDPHKKVQDILRESQRFHTAMLPFEHLGWLELREMHHLRDVLRYSLNMNIKPHRLVTLGWGQELELKSLHATCDDPFGIEVVLYHERLEWSIYYDERLITSDSVEDLLDDIQRVFTRLIDARSRPGMTIAEIFSYLAHR